MAKMGKKKKAPWPPVKKSSKKVKQKPRPGSGTISKKTARNKNPFGY